MSERTLDLVRDVLDHEILDVDGVPCGMVDDVEFGADDGGSLRIVALLVGARPMADRLPFGLGRLLHRFVRRSPVRVPWSSVARVLDQVRLSVTAASLGLDRGERRVSALVAHLPRS